MSILLLMDDDGPPFPRSLFASGEKGIWLDPSDFSTLFQDAAGTTPVTAVGQPVGLALDKSKGLALGSELLIDLDPTNATISSDLPPLTCTSTAGSGVFGAGKVALAIAGKAYRVLLSWSGNGGGSAINVQVGSQAVAVGSSPSGSVVINALTTSSGSIAVYRTSTAIGQTFSITGLSVREIAGNHAYQTTSASRPTLQQDSNGLYYLSFDGTDDGMATPSINFTGTDKMTVWVGVRKLSDVAIGTVVELSANQNTNPGVFALFAPLAPASPDFSWLSKGITAGVAGSGSNAAPITVVATGIGDIGGDISRLRLNGGAKKVESLLDQGTGNYGNYPLYIGRRGGTTLPFNGRLYQLIVRGAASSDGQIAATEAWCNAKTRAY